MLGDSRRPAVDIDLLLPIYRFNTWANEAIRAALLVAGEERARRPLDLWFGSAFAISAHICAGETIWISRLRDGVTPPRLLGEDDFPDVAALTEHWRDLDRQWEAYVAGLTPAALAETVPWTSQHGERFTHIRWQILLHLPFHSSEHRAHAATALTLLGVRHGPQDFHLQFMPPDAAALRSGPRQTP
jgi:uncharacterized damage-inducible protein DinB